MLDEPFIYRPVLHGSAVPCGPVHVTFGPVAHCRHKALWIFE
jgi:hypothetical protein